MVFLPPLLETLPENITNTKREQNQEIEDHKFSLETPSTLFDLAALDFSATEEIHHFGVLATSDWVLFLSDEKNPASRVTLPPLAS